MTTIKPEALESAQKYDQCWQTKVSPQEIFACDFCGERMTELEYCKHNGVCYGCLDLERENNK